MDTKFIAEAVTQANIKSVKSLTEIASALVESAGDLMKSGATCIVIDDPTYPYAGQRGTIQGTEADGAYYNVKFDNGTVAKIMSNQLLQA